MIEEADLRRLTAGRWLMPIMALLAETGESRFAILQLRLEVSRSALAAGLAALVEAGWIRRNPGHGHPLRPEYILTAEGEPIARFCRRVMSERLRLGLEPAQLSRWSLPILARLDNEGTRFTTLRKALAPVTPRALSLSLKQMLDVRLVNRRLEDDFPPVPLYGLTGRGERLAGAMGDHGVR